MAKPKERPAGKWVAIEYRNGQMYENGTHKDPVNIDGAILEVQIQGNIAWLLVLERTKYE